MAQNWHIVQILFGILFAIDQHGNVDSHTSVFRSDFAISHSFGDGGGLFYVLHLALLHIFDVSLVAIIYTISLLV